MNQAKLCLLLQQQIFQFLTLSLTSYTSFSNSSTHRKINIMGIMKGQMCLRGVINIFEKELPLFLCTKSSLTREEEGEFGNDHDCYSLKHMLSTL